MRMDTATPEESMRKTVACWNALADRYFEEERSLFADRTLLLVREHMVRDPLILDIGCGFGRAIKALREINIKRYIGVDPSHSMIRIAQREYPEHDFRLGNMCDLKKDVPEKCDAFLACASFMHVPKVLAVQALQSIRSVLQRGAIGFFSIPNGRESRSYTYKNSDGLVPPGYELLVESWTLDMLCPIVKRSEFEIIEPTYEDNYMLFMTVRAV